MKPAVTLLIGILLLLWGFERMSENAGGPWLADYLGDQLLRLLRVEDLQGIELSP